MSRLEEIRRDGGVIRLPDPGLEYVVATLIEVGPTMTTGMGAAPLSYEEIRAYQETRGIRLTSWEALTLRRLSLEWLIEAERAKDPDAAAPWQGMMTLEERRAMVQRKLDAAHG